jgi:hypothetical protein
MISRPPILAWLRQASATPTRLWSLILGGLAILCFTYTLLSPAPWEGGALKRVARGMEVAESAVPRGVFFDLKRLGELQLGTAAYRQIGLWQGALVAGIGLALASLSARWWVPVTHRPPRPFAPPAEGSPPGLWRARRIDWIMLAAMLVLAAFVRVPNLDRAIYFDEQDNLRRNFHGHVEIQPDGTRVWREAGWQEALWENRLGNNPVLLSVATQASLRAWRLATGAERERFDIVALRMPVLIAGLASIAALWWLLQLWGLRLAALIVAGLAAIHPMHIDYSLQARGYAFVLLCVPLALGFAWLAMRTDRWRDWWGLAVAVFLCLLSYPGSVHFAVMLHGGLLVALLWRRFRSGDAAYTGSIARLLAVNAAVGLVYGVIIAPHLPQVSYHFREVFELIALEPYWFFYAWSHYSTGTSFPISRDIEALRTETAGLGDVLLNRFATEEPILAFKQWALLPALIVWGLVWLHVGRRRTAAPAAMVLMLALAAPILALAHQQFTSLYFYYWYLTYALPAVLAGIAAGLGRLVQPLMRRPALLPRLGAVALLAIFFVLFSWQSRHWSGRSGRVAQGRDWPVNADGIEAVEFRRGRSHWITTRDGQSISRRDFYEASERTRAGR